MQKDNDFQRGYEKCKQKPNVLFKTEQIIIFLQPAIILYKGQIKRTSFNERVKLNTLDNGDFKS